MLWYMPHSHVEYILKTLGLKSSFSQFLKLKASTLANMRAQFPRRSRSWYVPIGCPWIWWQDSSSRKSALGKRTVLTVLSVNHKHQSSDVQSRRECHSWRCVMKSSLSLDHLTCLRIISRSLLALFTRAWISTGSFTLLFSRKASLILLTAYILMNPEEKRC